MYYQKAAPLLLHLWSKITGGNFNRALFLIVLDLLFNSYFLFFQTAVLSSVTYSFQLGDQLAYSDSVHFLIFTFFRSHLVFEYFTLWVVLTPICQQVSHIYSQPHAIQICFKDSPKNLLQRKSTMSRQNNERVYPRVISQESYHLQWFSGITAKRAASKYYPICFQSSAKYLRVVGSPPLTTSGKLRT